MNESLGGLGQLPEHLRREARAANRKDRERAELFEVLLKSPGWAAYLELLETRIRDMQPLILDPAGSVDGAMLLEYQKGTMRGLIIARDLPSFTIEQVKQLTSAPDTEPET